MATKLLVIGTSGTVQRPADWALPSKFEAIGVGSFGYGEFGFGGAGGSYAVADNINPTWPLSVSINAPIASGGEDDTIVRQANNNIIVRAMSGEAMFNYMLQNNFPVPGSFLGGTGGQWNSSAGGGGGGAAGPLGVGGNGTNGVSATVPGQGGSANGGTVPGGMNARARFT